MNRRQKILTGVTLPIFLFVGMLAGEAPRSDGFGPVLITWLALGVVYAGLFFILGPTRK
jgi:hypothetical protein